MLNDCFISVVYMCEEMPWVWGGIISVYSLSYCTVAMGGEPDFEFRGLMTLMP